MRLWPEASVARVKLWLWQMASALAALVKFIATMYGLPCMLQSPSLMMADPRVLPTNKQAVIKRFMLLTFGNYGAYPWALLLFVKRTVGCDDDHW